MMHLEPAASIIEELGGVVEVSRYLGLNPTTVRRFRYPREKYGTGGFFPTEYVFSLLALSYLLGKPIPLERFVLTPDQRERLGALDKTGFSTTSSLTENNASSPQIPEKVGMDS
ncbi:hypothetical protein [Labrenzia sp. DG1229]|uniref:hypothetical protein n=1 Tax=Labrenzia sp. DG1229 TaxID=681847 RepID=UPI0012EBAFAF|nr:hypothetical protein [Labrenzia sp. DG1229]